MSAYSDKNCRRRSILKMWRDRQNDRATDPETDTLTDNKGCYSWALVNQYLNNIKYKSLSVYTTKLWNSDWVIYPKEPKNFSEKLIERKDGSYRPHVTCSHFFGKITGICLGYSSEWAYQILHSYSLTRSWEFRGYPKNFGSHVTPAMPNFWKKKIPFFRLSLRKRAPNF